jgi:ribonuclease HI
MPYVHLCWLTRQCGVGRDDDGPPSLSCVEIHPEDTVVIYTDGSRKAKPGRGGIGIVLCWTNDDGQEEEHWESPPGYLGVTVPQMELKAVIEGLKLLLRKPPVVPPHLYRKVRIYADANYIVENHDRAKYQWSTNRWRNRDGAPIENGELWRELIKVEKKLGLRVEVMKVEGHGKNPHNQKADQLAKASREMAQKPPLVPGKVRRKQSTKRLRKGTVPFEQELTIHVHKGERMRPQNVNQFEFTVRTAGPLFEEVGLASADTEINIREGHTYRVRLNDDEGKPEIVAALFEVIKGTDP